MVRCNSSSQCHKPPRSTLGISDFYLFIQMEFTLARVIHKGWGSQKLLGLSNPISSFLFGKNLMLFGHYSAYFLLVYSFHLLIDCFSAAQTTPKLFKYIFLKVQVMKITITIFLTYL